MMPGHPCPLCKADGVPVYWVACGKCFQGLPPPLRRELWGAWRERVVDPVAYQEALIGALMVRGRDAGAGFRLGESADRNRAA